MWQNSITDVGNSSGNCDKLGVKIILHARLAGMECGDAWGGGAC